MQPRPSRVAKAANPPVTICIGFSCMCHLVMASDSQMSMGPKYKQCNEPKLSAINFGGNKWGILAIAGSLDGARLFQEQFESGAWNIAYDGEHSVREFIDSTLKQTRAKLLDAINHPATTSEERQNHLAEHNFEGIVGFYNNLSPVFYTIELRRGLAVRGMRPFHTIGCGSDIAGFVLTGAHLSGFGPESAIGIAVYAVESCKRFDQACGGPLQVMVLAEDSPKKPWSLRPDLLRAVSRDVHETAETIHQDLADQITFNMSQRAAAISQSLEEYNKQP